MKIVKGLEYFCFGLIVLISAPILILTYALHYVAESFLKGDRDGEM